MEQFYSNLLVRACATIMHLYDFDWIPPHKDIKFLFNLQSQNYKYIKRTQYKWQDRRKTIFLTKANFENWTVSWKIKSLHVCRGVLQALHCKTLKIFFPLYFNYIVCR